MEDSQLKKRDLIKKKIPSFLFFSVKIQEESKKDSFEVARVLNDSPAAEQMRHRVMGQLAASAMAICLEWRRSGSTCGTISAVALFGRPVNG